MKCVLRTSPLKIGAIGTRSYGTSSKSWLRRQETDFYVKEAKRLGYRSRAAFKLLDIHHMERQFLRNCNVVIDLGAAPGSWTQVIQSILDKRRNKSKFCKIVSVDLLDMNPFANYSKIETKIIKGDFTDEKIMKQIENETGKADAILSDMSPNTSGVKSLDQGRIIQLCEAALSFALKRLKSNGHLLVKMFSGPEEKEFITELEKHFEKVKSIKPKSSRSESKEVYIYARGLKGSTQSQYHDQNSPTSTISSTTAAINLSNDYE